MGPVRTAHTIGNRTQEVPSRAQTLDHQSQTMVMPIFIHCTISSDHIPLSPADNCLILNRVEVLVKSRTQWVWESNPPQVTVEGLCRSIEWLELDIRIVGCHLSDLVIKRLCWRQNFLGSIPCDMSSAGDSYTRLKRLSKAFRFSVAV